MLDYSLLGPLVVARDGQPVEITSPKQRMLLIRLLLDANATVPRDVIVDDLWRGRPPAQAVATLRSYVSHLRGALGSDPDGASVIVTEGGGYGIEVQSDAIDTVRFEHLAGRGRELLERDDPEAAVAALDEALAQWRGQPLSDVAYEDFARAAIARLEERRSVATEDRLDGLLALGRHAEAVAVLDGLTAQHTLRERPHAQLMLALYRSGRAPEALEVHRRFRDTLSEHLGLDPSASFDTLRDRILQQANDLDLPASPAAEQSTAPPATAVSSAPAAAVPAGDGPPTGAPLPSLLTELVGRTDELVRLRDFLGRSRLVSLLGPGGAGKTTLALAIAHEVAAEQSGDVWFVPLSAVAEPEQVPAAVAEVLGLTVDPAAAGRAVIEHLRGRAALLVLDNCEHLADACAVLVEDLLRGTSELRVMTTTREALGVPGELQMNVPPLGTRDAVDLFRRRAIAVRPDLDLDAYAEAIGRICERLDGLPLAIELAAARVRTISPEEVEARLDDRFGLLASGPRTAASRHRTLRAVVDWSHDLLAADERALLRRLAVFRGGWSLAAAEDVCVDDLVPDVLDTLHRLVDRSLVVVEGDRFGMLETITTYATERLVDAGEADTFGERHAGYFAGLAESTETDLRGGDQAAAMRRLRVEQQNLRQALHWSRHHADRRGELGLALAASLGWYWYVGRQVDGRSELTAMLAAAPDAGPHVRARALQALSLALRPAGCVVHPHPAAAAAARESITLFSGSGDLAAAALSQLLVAVEGVVADEVGADLAAVEEARATLRSVDDAWGIALADFVEMELRLGDGQTEEALRLGRRAARAFDELEDRWGRSAVRLHLGIGLKLAGRLDEAGAVLLEVVELSPRVELPNNLARAFVELGEVALQRGEVSAAATSFDQAAEVAADLADDAMDGLVALGRAGLAQQRLDVVAAREHFGSASERFRRAGVEEGVARADAGLATLAALDPPTTPDAPVTAEPAS